MRCRCAKRTTPKARAPFLGAAPRNLHGGSKSWTKQGVNRPRVSEARLPSAPTTDVSHSVNASEPSGLAKYYFDTLSRTARHGSHPGWEQLGRDSVPSGRYSEPAPASMPSGFWCSGSIMQKAEECDWHSSDRCPSRRQRAGRASNPAVPAESSGANLLTGRTQSHIYKRDRQLMATAGKQRLCQLSRRSALLDQP